MVTHDLDEALMLADRLVLFTGMPGRIAETLDITTPRPRSRDDPGLRQLGARLERHLAAAAEAAELTESERSRMARF
jgi:ABC-type nitrate/sulfonate/bicarbonate transport system ATPase subunit